MVRKLNKPKTNILLGVLISFLLILILAVILWFLGSKFSDSRIYRNDNYSIKDISSQVGVNFPKGTSLVSCYERNGLQAASWVIAEMPKESVNKFIKKLPPNGYTSTLKESIIEFKKGNVWPNNWNPESANKVQTITWGANRMVAINLDNNQKAIVYAYYWY